MEKTNWSVQGYVKTTDKDLRMIMEGITRTQAIALADRLSRIFKIECHAVGKI